MEMKQQKLVIVAIHNVQPVLEKNKTNVFHVLEIDS